MTRPAALLPGFFIVVGPNERIVIVADTLGMPGAMRFRTRLHAEAVLEKILAGDAVRDLNRWRDGYRLRTGRAA